MKKPMNFAAGLIAAALVCAASVSPSHAAGSNFFVSGGGSDTNPCTLAQPCRSITHALVVAGSELVITCLDAGPYTERVLVTFSFTVDCRGTVYMTPGNEFAFTLSPTSNSLVTFRHVIFDGTTIGGAGGAVQITGGTVVFEDCTFQNFNAATPGEAVQFAPTVAGAHLTITDSVFANNGFAGGGGGVIVQPAAGITAGAVIERTQFAGNTYGIAAGGAGGGTALVEVRYSTTASSIYDGIYVVTEGSVASVVVEHSASVRNGGSGMNAQGSGAYVSLRDSTVDWNSTGLAAGGGGVILSYQNNMIAGNISPGVTPLSLSQQ
jgi:hypothetical protein